MTSETPHDQQPEQTPPAPPPPPPPAAPPVYQQRTPPPPPPRRPASPWAWGCGIAAGGCLLFGVFLLLMLIFAAGAVKTGLKNRPPSTAPIAVIRVEGVITSTSSASPFGGASAGSDDLVKLLQDASEDDKIRAIVLRVNSPGGSAAASQEIFEAVGRAKAHTKVVVSMADLAASGGYYISAPADLIYANPATATGSIGVITQYMNYQDLLGKIGVKTETIKSGKMKDMMSPTAPLTDEARAVMKGIVMDVYGQFVDAVALGRKGKLTRDEVLKLADGRIYSGAQAKKLHLIDELGGLEDAVRGAAKLAGLPEDSEYQEYGTQGLLKQLFGSQFSGSSTRAVVTTSTQGMLCDEFAARLVPGPWQLPARPTEQ